MQDRRTHAPGDLLRTDLLMPVYFVPGTAVGRDALRLGFRCCGAVELNGGASGWVLSSLTLRGSHEYGRCRLGILCSWMIYSRVGYIYDSVIDLVVIDMQVVRGQILTYSTVP